MSISTEIKLNKELEHYSEEKLIAWARTKNPWIAYAIVAQILRKRKTMKEKLTSLISGK